MRSTNKKFFGAAVFQYCCRGVGEQPTFAEQMKLHNEKEQKSKSKSEESQLPLKLEGSNEGKGFRGNCDSQASWGCAPALPNRFRVVFLRAMFHMKQSEIHCNCSPGTVAKLLLTASGKQGGAVLFAPPRKAVAFLTTPSVCQKHGTGISLPAGSD